MKILGPKVLCIKGKHHSVGIGSGKCAYCNKQIHKPDPKRLNSLLRMSSKITQQVFT